MVKSVVFALSEDGLYSMTGDGTNPTTKPCHCPAEVFARCVRPVEVVGPLIEEEAKVVHEGFGDKE